jgi:hypothetical protein
MVFHATPAYPELVEGLLFFSAIESEGQGFDKLSPNGVVIGDRAPPACPKLSPIGVAIGDWANV